MALAYGGDTAPRAKPWPDPLKMALQETELTGIRLNWRLMHFRPAVMNYVVVHELAHLHEMNHSPRFWAHVQAQLPAYAALRAELRGESLPLW